MNTTDLKATTRPQEFSCQDVSQASAELLDFWNQVNELGQGPKWEEMAIRLNHFRLLLARSFASDMRHLQGCGAFQDAGGAERFHELSTQSMLLLDHLIDDVEHLKKHDATFLKWSQVAAELEEIFDRVAEHDRLVNQMSPQRF